MRKELQQDIVSSRGLQHLDDDEDEEEEEDDDDDEGALNTDEEDDVDEEGRTTSTQHQEHANDMPVSAVVATAGGAGASTAHGLMCRTCNKLFDNLHRLQRHMMCHDMSPELRKFKCDYCSKAFKFKHHLKVSDPIQSHPTTTTTTKISVFVF